MDGRTVYLQFKRADHGVDTKVMNTASWLCKDEYERQRLLDMVGRLQKGRALAFLAIGVALASYVPSVGWTVFLPYLTAAAVFAASEHRIHERRRPEYWMFVGWSFCQVMIAIGVVMTGGPDSVFVMWLAVPTVTLGARFSSVGQMAGMALTAILIAGVTIGPDMHGLVDEPYRVVGPMMALLGLIALARPLMRSDLEHRAGATRDPLTGLSNRAALDHDTVAVFADARRSGGRVALIVIDIDHFKEVNDTYGHERGDDVLREVSSAMQVEMRASDRLYRIGGEEFIVVLRGANAEDAALAAERLRSAVERTRPGGMDISISLGTSAGWGEAGFAELYRLADEALYAAKRHGRNRVCAAGVV